jgi:tyrosyl-tRNA synthetase
MISTVRVRNNSNQRKERKQMSAHLQANIRTSVENVATIESVINRGVASLMPEDGLRALLEEKPINLYLGIDPTSPFLHLGHLVPLRKLRQFQMLGHHVYLLFGTFTGMIGDPSDKSATRVQLTFEQVQKNVATYVNQAGMVLEMSPTAANPIQLVHNHEWLGRLSFEELINLSSHFTVNQLLGRKSYQDRLDNGIPLHLHEMLYPVMQAYDAVVLDVDLEIGGKDQIPNMLAGAHLVQRMNNHPKWVLGMRLIEDVKGAKMGKTSGNVVNLVELPEVIYEALMTWPDSTIGLGLELLTDVPMSVVAEVESAFEQIAGGSSKFDPVALKEAFAFRVVAELVGQKQAVEAAQIFDLVKRQKQLPSRMQEVALAGEMSLGQLLAEVGLATSEIEGVQLANQGAVWLNQKRVNKNVTVPLGEHVVAIGKNTIKNIRRVVLS